MSIWFAAVCVLGSKETDYEAAMDRGKRALGFFSLPILSQFLWLSRDFPGLSGFALFSRSPGKVPGLSAINGHEDASNGLEVRQDFQGLTL